MRKLLSVIFWILVGMGLMYWLLHHHIIKTKDGWILVPKSQLELRETFVNISGWTSKDLKTHPQVATALVEHGHRDLIVGLLAGEAQGTMEKVLDTAPEEEQQ